jgi:hypothetical protein
MESGDGPLEIKDRRSKGERPFHPSVKGVAIGIGIRGIFEEGALKERCDTGV